MNRNTAAERYNSRIEKVWESCLTAKAAAEKHDEHVETYEKCGACGRNDWDKGNYCETIIGTLNDFWICKGCGRGMYVDIKEHIKNNSEQN